MFATKQSAVRIAVVGVLAVAGGLSGFAWHQGEAAPRCVAENPSPENPPEVIARFREHYGAVLAELRSADTGHLTSQQQELRAYGLSLLADYQQRGEFGVNTDFPGARVPYFVDAQGRRCALAHLLDGLGETRLVADIAASQNHDYVVDLAATRPALEGRLREAGFSLTDAARIHAPSSGAAGSSRSSSSSSGSSSSTGSVTGSTTSGSASAPYGGPSKTGGSQTGGSPSCDADTPRGSPSITGSGGAPAKTGTGTARSHRDNAREASTHSASKTGESEPAAWSTWWELNAFRFLAPAHLEDSQLESRTPGGQARRSSSGERDQSLASRTRGQLWPQLVEATRHPDSGVRARAAVAVGRLDQGTALDVLKPLLRDPSSSVRHAALLGLGATGTMQSAALLLHLVQDGKGPDGSTVSPWARSVALVALGVGRRHGLSDSLDALVAETNSGPQASAPEEFATALLFYHSLAGGLPDQELVTGWLADPRGDWMLRCRAAESLPLYDDPALLSQLVRALGDTDAQVRRSAALALGSLSHPLTSAALKTATELEAEPVARGYALLSLGELRGSADSDFLRRTLVEGGAELQPFAAISLGLLARQSGDGAARAELRELHGSTGNHDLRTALTLALGLARDTASGAALLDDVQHAADPRQRHFAALALALIGDPSARPGLQAALAAEDSPLALVGIAQALASFGVEEDVGALLKVLRRVHSPESQAQLAVALGWHRTDAGVGGLVALLGEASLPDAARAATIEALGLLLDEQPGHALAAVAASTNADALPDWMVPLLQRSTL
ncbi:MAG: HEAT repeat domain-containing protein [Planctomycetota bacterium]